MADEQKPTTPPPDDAPKPKYVPRWAWAIVQGAKAIVGISQKGK